MGAFKYLANKIKTYWERAIIPQPKMCQRMCYSPIIARTHMSGCSAAAAAESPRLPLSPSPHPAAEGSALTQACRRGWHRHRAGSGRKAGDPEHPAPRCSQRCTPHARRARCSQQQLLGRDWKGSDLQQKEMTALWQVCAASLIDLE